MFSLSGFDLGLDLAQVGSGIRPMGAVSVGESGGFAFLVVEKLMGLRCQADLLVGGGGCRRSRVGIRRGFPHDVEDGFVSLKPQRRHMVLELGTTGDAIGSSLAAEVGDHYSDHGGGSFGSNDGCGGGVWRGGPGVWLAGFGLGHRSVWASNWMSWLLHGFCFGPPLWGGAGWAAA
ncbi:hypothetical protein RchiOBHm_Chr6g0273511 [Rosa chinensis]|uniref:Uncharacterized protein n=1 Tax=Rosa chinensis TaxID=74649 RepID=A0A2P6PRH9_ROSCH|nr:hypothetical protein RchiOBHm_Chr6g0273511 [Rosa chinensis]